MLGTETGGILEAVFEEEGKDKKGRSVKPLHELAEGGPVVGLSQQFSRDGRLLVLAATPSRLFVFSGGPTLESLFQSYAANSAGMRSQQRRVWFGNSVGLPRGVSWTVFMESGKDQVRTEVTQTAKDGDGSVMWRAHS